jgi:two-component system response regulator MprA
VKVLVVEDDEAIAEALVSLLEEAGHQARHAPDGRRALEELRTGERTCVILLDMTMPVMNGWRFREEQMKDKSLADIPVVVCTADALAEQKALEIGAAGWLRKPLDPERLLETVKRFCPPVRSAVVPE